MKRTEVAASRDRLFRRAGLAACSVGIDLDKGVQLGIQSFDTRKM